MKRLVLLTACLLALSACKKKKTDDAPAPAPASGSSAPAMTGSAPGSAAGSAGSAEPTTKDPCFEQCMKEGPDADTPFKDDFKKLSKDEQENACSAHCADANMPAK